MHGHGHGNFRILNPSLTHPLVKYMYYNRIFRENHVTGYDFPELVENKGQAIIDELNIDVKFRTKIVRAVNGRMFGIGQVPSKPGGIEARIESCSTISLTWTKTQTNSLPVHKYRVVRRKIGGSNQKKKTKKVEKGIPMKAPMGGHPEISNGDAPDDIMDLDNNVEMDGDSVSGSSSGLSTIVKAPASNGQDEDFSSCPIHADEDITMNTVNTYTSSEWTTIYDGSETECVDTGLERGMAYMYRIQAWNLVGKSEWAVLDPTESWIEHGCNKENEPASYADVVTPVVTKVARTVPVEAMIHVESINDTGKKRRPLFKQFLQIIAAWGGYIVNAVLTLGAVSTTLLRLRRATVTSTAARIEPFFPWAFRLINKILKNTIGEEFIPQIFTMGRHEALTLHDNVVKSVGLNGYVSSPPGVESSIERKVSDRGASARELLTSSSMHNINSGGNETEVVPASKGKSKKDQKSGPFLRKRSQKSPLVFTRDTTKMIQKPEPVIESRSDSEDENKVNKVTKQVSTSRPKTPSKLSVRRFGRNKVNTVGDKAKINVNDDKTELNRQVSTDSNRSNVPTPSNGVRNKSHSSSFDSAENARNAVIEDHNRCNSCRKKYKFPKRCRHHCARCSATFCHKHGTTTHSNLVPCKVPGDCVCNVCLGIS